MRKLIAFLFASTLLGAGLYLLFLQLFVSLASQRPRPRCRARWLGCPGMATVPYVRNAGRPRVPGIPTLQFPRGE